MKLFIIGFLAIGFLGCAGKQVQEEAEKRRFEETLELSEVTNAQKVLAAGQFDKALILFQDFIGKKPNSKYWAKAKFGEADAYEGQGKSQEALTILRKLRDLGFAENRPMAALASYKMSYVYESLGDDQQTLATLFEANAQADFLPEEVALAEIPARLAVLYSRMGKRSESLNWLAKADRGLKKSIEVLGFDRQWVAKTYYNMGRVSTQQLGNDNFLATVDAQRIVQVYHLKSLKLEDETWSTKSKQALLENYQELLNQLRRMKSDTRAEAEAKTKAGGALTSLLADAELYAPLGGAAYKRGEQEFYKYVSTLKETIRLMAFKSEATMSLTDEAKDRNSLKKNFNFEEPEAYEPRMVPTSEDPNL